MRLFRVAFGAAAALVVADGAHAQGAGAVRAPLEPALRNPVELNAPAPPVRLQPNVEGPPLQAQTGPGAAAEVPIGEVRISGAKALTPNQLAPAIAGLANTTIPLARLEEARLNILRAYREAGYPFASVNAGLTRRGTVADLNFAIVEGFVAEVKLEGDIGPAGTQVLRFLNRLIGQRPVSTAAIERALLLAQDIPGLTVRGTLRPLATEPGALQLVAQVERRWYSGYLNVDNRGYRLVGPWQGLLVGGLNSFTEFGERTELSLFGAQDSTQWFAQGSVEAFVGGSGLRVRLYAGSGQTRPSGSLRALGYYGETQVGGISANYPIIRSRPVNLFAVSSFDVFDGVVETGTSGRARASRDAIRTFRVGLDGQLLDSWIPFLPAATNLGSFRVGQGITGLGATRNGYPLSGRSGAENFGFTKINGEVQRTQPLFSPGEGQMISVQGLFAGQWTDDILPQAEKFYLGGNRLGRGYYAGQVTGDKAWGLAIELQYDLAFDLPTTQEFGAGRVAAQFYAFRDIARAVENRPNDANRRLSSWGGGVRTVVNDTVQFDLEAVYREVKRPDGAAAESLHGTVVLFRTLVKF
ncbi:ShlB/FhaC/HecB family hemolysin secretion/activation protein [Belnapia sp. T6]|uniref:ShlB/FhaC/HecB family hemolysin secretion/activation protein n=1 Tax=Belnapia mucosa TaxID=2804532 RepID=A0ABS1V5G0_9PROT|nr:ShlB/FhaC/HecB family hemolysin secretion/activation protein [Belnapia mucosa]MBL6456901.1 ShlB/FhaC/HecB family hemolysin secretion/activation protein [Belnapia mucosa]